MSTKSKVINIIVGLFLLIPAIALILYANLGLDPLGCLVDSISQLTYNTTKGAVALSYGNALTCVNICFLTFHLIRNKRIPFFIFGLLMSIVLGTGIDLLSLNITFLPTTLVFNILWFVIGYLTMCLGIAFIQKGRIQKMPFEGFHEAISDIVKKDINVVRVYVEISLFIIAIILYAIVLLVVNKEFNLFNSLNVGTVFIMLLTGPTVNLIYKKIIKGEIKDEQQTN
ncbi:MAG: DUF6198 family protein [bacterium]